MTVKIGHARSNENNKAKGGKAGDQTGKEVVIQNWYDGNWTAVFRAKDANDAKKIAKTAEQVCSNNNIGYDQNQRATLYEQAEKCNWNIQKITEKCECDCSSLVSVCVNAAGIKISKNMYTGNQKTVLLATGKFELLTDEKYLTKPDHLKIGDILLTSGHTAIVVSKMNLKIESAKSFDKMLAGTYKVIATKLNIRNGAGTNKQVLVAIPEKTEVNCYGYYTNTDNVAWLYVQFTFKGKKYTGFASSKYLVR